MQRQRQPVSILVRRGFLPRKRGLLTLYSVSAKTHNQASSTLELFVKPVAWKSAYSFKVEIHESNDEYIVNRLDHLKRSTIKVDRRDNDPSLTVSSISTLPSSARITFPSPNPKASPTATTIAQAVTTSYTDTKILPPDLLEGAVGGLSIGGIQIPDGVSVKCTNCTTYGSIRLVSGSFTSGSSTNDTRDNIILDAIDDVDDAVGFITDGYLQVAATGLGAHIELETIWSASVSHDFEITLATIPLQPWSIPNIAVIGPIFIPKLVIGVGVSADVNFKSGFSVSVPNNSTATVNIGNVTQSSLSGFDKTKFTSLPFTSDVENIALNVSLGLHPELLLGISFFGGIGEAGAGIFLDMPKLSLQVQPVSVAANERCELIADKGAANNALSLLKANLTHIVPVVDFAGGFVAEASMKVGGLPSIGKQTAWTPLATTFPGPTVCLAYDREQKDYVVASKAVAVAAAASSSIVAAATSSSAANRVSSPFSGAIIGLVGLQAVVICFWVVVGGLFVFEDQISSRLSI